MDKIVEKKNAEEIRKFLAKDLKVFHFSRTKPTFYTRLKSDRIDFVHLHKFSFGPSFRVHIGTRFLCDTFDAVALNGIDSDGSGPKYKLQFDESRESVKLCVAGMMNFILEEGFKWYEHWSHVTRLLNVEKTPINRFKEKYLEFLGDDTPKDVIVQSYRLVGIKNFS
jgi:hypothetical protein